MRICLRSDDYDLIDQAQMGILYLSGLRMGCHDGQDEVPLAIGEDMSSALLKYTSEPAVHQIFYFAGRYLLLFALIGM